MNMATTATVRRVRLAAVLLFLLWIPVIFPVLWLGLKLTGSATPGLVAGGLWLLAFASCGIALAVLRCPQCGKRFVRFNWIYPRHCARCGFRC